MIRNEQERRNAEEQIEYLRSNLEDVWSGERTEVSEGVARALTMQIHDMERELAEYEDLKKGLRLAFEVGSLDEFGEVVTKARIARGWSQANLARVLGIKPQQVQRYESNDWQKISFWRLQEAVEALGLDIVIHARVHGHEDQDVEPLQTTSPTTAFYVNTSNKMPQGVVTTVYRGVSPTRPDTSQMKPEIKWSASRTPVMIGGTPTVPVWQKLEEAHA